MLLLQVPALPGDAHSGKLYEKIIMQMLVCRVAASFANTTPLSELIGKPYNDPIFDADVVVRACSEEKKIKAFPRAAELMADGKWRNVACSKMPTPQGAPWHCSESLDSHNTVVDGLLTLPLAASVNGKKSVCIGVQNKEHENADEAVRSFRMNKRNSVVDGRPVHLDWGPNNEGVVGKFLDPHHFVHTLVTPNAPPTGSMKAFDIRSGRTLHEALITHEDIRRYCPMVAYSACDARVLQEVIPKVAKERDVCKG